MTDREKIREAIREWCVCNLHRYADYTGCHVETIDEFDSAQDVADAIIQSIENTLEDKQ